jgi:hypothetical protein
MQTSECWYVSSDKILNRRFEMKLLDIIQEHESWRIIDSSKLTTFMTCPRKFFFRHILGWTPSAPSNDLVFGSSWHLAAEHLLRSGYTDKSLREAQMLFLYSYRQVFEEHTDELFYPKSPSNAVKALESYFARFSQSDRQNFSVLHTEVGGAALIGPDMPMYFKLDALLLDEQSGMYVCLDHKTSKYKFFNWTESWDAAPQMQFYAHVLRCLYGNKPQEMRIRGAFFYKSKPAEFAEAFPAIDEHKIEGDLNSLRSWYISLLTNLEDCITEDDTEEELMLSFPKNTLSCYNYNRPCPYLTVCSAWNNPLRNTDEEPPMSMHVEYWDPRKDDKIREAFDLTKGETGE